MPTPPEVQRLVDDFSTHLEDYKSGRYNETQVRAEFVDPFFNALGWDVHNKAGNAETYKDVILEYSLKISGSSKAPDYCFRIGGVNKFFLETKKPSVHIQTEKKVG